jgi:hypothetical protein
VVPPTDGSPGDAHARRDVALSVSEASAAATGYQRRMECGVDSIFVPAIGFTQNYEVRGRSPTGLISRRLPTPG